MRSLIRRQLPDGSRQEQVLDSISLTFGRGTDNAVELPGLTVAPRHAKLSYTAPGKYLVESTALVGLEINGIAGQRERELVPGDKVRIGDHAFTIVEPGVNVDLVIDLEVVQPKIATAREAPPEPTVTLHGTGMGYRRASWALGIVVLVVALVLPLASTSLPDQWPGLLPSDELWTSGRISGGHTYFGTECATCHQALFERVTDAACTSCHATTKHHSDNPAIRAMAGFEELRCASCHREHDAVAGLDPPHPDICTSCHASPQFADFPDLAPAADFGTLHPPFRPLVMAKAGTGPGGQAVYREERRDQAPELKDQHGLIFNHALHLDPAGVRGPDGTRQLACGDCHAPDASRQGFLDLRYATHCAGCHALDANLGGTAVRLPHANEAMLRELLDKYLSRAPAAPEPAAEPGRRRVGESAERGSAGELGTEVQRTASRLCAKCHELQTAADGLPQARPLALRHSWLTRARFTHAEHEAMECTRCHAAAKSQVAEDLLLPALGDCRTCHAGVDSPRGVASTCIDCHRLHQARQPWTADGRPKGESVSERGEAQQE
jgi:hypothetical protein